jgi:hypothetical protein
VPAVRADLPPGQHPRHRDDQAEQRPAPSRPAGYPAVHQRDEQEQQQQHDEQQVASQIKPATLRLAFRTPRRCAYSAGPPCLPGPTCPRPPISRVRAYDMLLPSAQRIFSKKCPRGDLNTQTGEISLDRGNHTISVTRQGEAVLGIQICVRYLVICLDGMVICPELSGQRICG